MLKFKQLGEKKSLKKFERHHEYKICQVMFAEYKITKSEEKNIRKI